jgi:signal peptidase II
MRILPSAPQRRLVVAAFAVLAADQLTKLAAVAFLSDGELRAGVFAFTLVRNPGAAFSILTSHTWVFTILAASVLAAAVLFRRRILATAPAFAVGAALGGVAGNLVDRVLRAPSPFNGHVVDFLSIGSFPVFNLADTALVLALSRWVLHAARDGDPSTAAQRSSDTSSGTSTGTTSGSFSDSGPGPR